MNTKKIIDKAKNSIFYRWILNFSINRMIPFNQPHGFKVVEITDTKITTKLPYKLLNFNHIKGLHACALATLSEFTTGFLMISRLDPKKYRIILKTLEMEYHYQGKMDSTGSFEISDEWLDTNIYTPLKSNDSTVVICEVKIHDKEGNHLTTGKIHWQVKSWQKVKTKITT